jgi:hypothetical protein
VTLDTPAYGTEDRARVFEQLHSHVPSDAVGAATNFAAVERVGTDYGLVPSLFKCPSPPFAYSSCRDRVAWRMLSSDDVAVSAAAAVEASRPSKVACVSPSRPVSHSPSRAHGVAL